MLIFIPDNFSCSEVCSGLLSFFSQHFISLHFILACMVFERLEVIHIFSLEIMCSPPYPWLLSRLFFLIFDFLQFEYNMSKCRVFVFVFVLLFRYLSCLIFSELSGSVVWWLTIVQRIFSAIIVSNISFGLFSLSSGILIIHMLYFLWLFCSFWIFWRFFFFKSFFSLLFCFRSSY